MKASPQLPDQNARNIDLNLKAMKLIGYCKTQVNF